MSSSMALVSEMIGLALTVRDLDEATRFYTDIWGLEVAARDEAGVRLRGQGPWAAVLTLIAGSEPGLAYIVFAAPGGCEGVDRLAANLRRLGYPLASEPGTVFPEGRHGLACHDADGREIRVVGLPAVVLPRTGTTRPVGLGHVVLNTPNGDESLRFYVEGLGMRLTDSVAQLPMTFLGCNEKHHCIALWAGAERPFLNHLAFELPDVETFLRQTGALVQAGVKLMAGPGRHTAGNNTFAYFIGPDGLAIEITADMEIIEDHSTWLPRTWTVGADQWGFGIPLGSEEMRDHTT